MEAHSQLALGNEKGSYKGWCVESTLLVSLWSRPSWCPNPWAHHQMCSFDRWSPSSPPQPRAFASPGAGWASVVPAKALSSDGFRTSSNNPPRGNVGGRYPRSPALWWDSSGGHSVRTSRVCSGTGPLLARAVTAHWHTPVVSAHLSQFLTPRPCLVGLPPDQLRAS